MSWQLWLAWRDGAGLADTAALAAWVAGLAAAAIGILCMLAYLYSRGTIYTLTSKRIVIRTGLALPVTLNLPLALIETASVRHESSATGSIALSVTKPNRIAWLVLWPNVRPWTFTNPQPLLRCLSDVGSVAPILARALEADGRGQRMQQDVRGASIEQVAQLPSGATLAA